MRRILLLLALAALTASGQQPKANANATRLPPELIDSLEAHADLVYARYGDRALQLDLWRPKSAASGEAHPAIICIHGGGWAKGERGSMAKLAQALAARGYVTATISYRLSGEAKFPAAIQDCKAAVRYLRANAERFGIRSTAIGVTGLSAGGHLAALLATSASVDELEGEGGNSSQSSAVQACVAMGAQSDLENPRVGEISARPADPFYRPFLGDQQSSIPRAYALASPRHHLDKSDPPLLFMTGELDDASTHADEMRADLEKLQIPTGLAIIPGAPHAFLGQQKAFDTCIAACDEFFAKHLRKN